MYTEETGRTAGWGSMQEVIQPIGATESNRGTEEIDELFDIMSNSRRRAVFHYLKQGDGTAVEVSRLSRELAAWECGVEPEQVSYDDRHSIHTSLRQFHLPKMEDGGIVEFNDQGTRVTLTDEADRTDIYVEAVSEDEVRWSTYFVSLSAVLALTTGAAILGIQPPTALSVQGWVILESIAFAVSSLVFWSSQQDDLLGSEGVPPLFSEE